MAVKVYRKRQPTMYRPKERAKSQRRFERRILFLHRIAPFFLVSVGLFLLGSVALPIMVSLFSDGTQLRVGAQEQMADVASDQVIVQKLRRENLLPTPKPTPIVVDTELPYIDLSNWFPDHSIPVVLPAQAKTYSLSIPSIGIQDAQVVLGGNNLDQHLIQYPGTALPGENGAPVIFGHSVLRQFYNPKVTNPRRYISIFSTIMTLKKGDSIVIADDNVTYTYRVKSKVEVSPTDPAILEQHTSERELKLITCTPEGTTLRRGIVTAVLDEGGL